MLTIFGKPHRNGGFCDGVSRRDFLTIGGTVLGGGAVAAQPARRRVAQPASSRRTRRSSTSSCPAVRRTWTCGTSSRTRPPRSAASSSPIKTNVPGIEICEHFPQMAKMMDKFAVIRSLVGCAGDHDAFQCMTGRKTDAAADRLLARAGRLGVEGAGPGQQGGSAAPDADVPHRRATLGLSRRRRLPRPGPRPVPARRRQGQQT